MTPIGCSQQFSKELVLSADNLVFDVSLSPGSGIKSWPAKRSAKTPQRTASVGIMYDGMYSSDTLTCANRKHRFVAKMILITLKLK